MLNSKDFFNPDIFASEDISCPSSTTDLYNMYQDICSYKGVSQQFETIKLAINSTNKMKVDSFNNAFKRNPFLKTLVSYGIVTVVPMLDDREFGSSTYENVIGKIRNIRGLVDDFKSSDIYLFSDDTSIDIPSLEELNPKHNIKFFDLEDNDIIVNPKIEENVKRFLNENSLTSDNYKLYRNVSDLYVALLMKHGVERVEDLDDGIRAIISSTSGFYNADMTFLNTSSLACTINNQKLFVKENPTLSYNYILLCDGVPLNVVHDVPDGFTGSHPFENNICISLYNLLKHKGLLIRG